MRTRLVTLLVSAFALVGIVAACGQTSTNTQPAAQPTAAEQSKAAIALNQTMRKLWEEHVTWTRLYIVSALSGLPDAQPTADRLLRNQDDIGNAMKPFYGAAAGDQLTALLRTHITQAADLVKAAKAGDNAALGKAKNAWFTNADDIATFLSQANPKNWPVDQVKAMMHTHLDQTIAETTDHLKGNTTQEIADYDAIENHILKLADTLSTGIVAQYPNKFTT
jgi:hypothetical protein